MTITKDIISSPLEAGASLLDSQKLPPQLNHALEYVSDRLIRKHLHLTLVVVRHDAQHLPQSPSIPPSTPCRSSSSSPSLFSKMHLPSLPGTPRSTTSSRSSSPFSPIFPPSSPSLPSPTSANQYGITLHHASSLSPKAARHLTETITRASKKYSLGDGWLAPPTSPTTSHCQSPTSPTFTPSKDLIHRSLHQNDVLFSSEGLTLLSLDHVYTFKSALSTYTRLLNPSPTTPTATSREDTIRQRHEGKAHAVESLRLLILAQKGRRISASYLLRAYDHLSISIPALRSVNEAYKRCFLSEGVEMDGSASGKRGLENRALVRSRSGRRVASGELQGMDRGPWFRAPDTPGGWEEVTPVTRGEWNWLMGERVGVGRVEIC